MQWWNIFSAACPALSLETPLLQPLSSDSWTYRLSPCTVHAWPVEVRSASSQSGTSRREPPARTFIILLLTETSPAALAGKRNHGQKKVEKGHKDHWTVRLQVHEPNVRLMARTAKPRGRRHDTGGIGGQIMIFHSKPFSPFDFQLVP